MTIDTAGRVALIARIRAEEKIPGKPRNVLGFGRAIPVPEMEAPILANLAVTPGDLHMLADECAGAMRKYLESPGRVAPVRLIVAAPRLTAEGIRYKGAPPQVDFSLR